MGHIYPPAILGHDEQELLKNSGLPAAAWIHGARVIPNPTREEPDGAKLQVMCGDAPRSVARLINRRAYRKTSAEIYDEPPDGCRIPGVSGKVLRAVAFLGRDIPRVKTLEDIPQFNEETGESTDWVDAFATGNFDGYKYKRADLDDMARNYTLLSKAGINPAKFSDESSRHATGRAFRRVFMEAPGGNGMDELRKKLIAAGMPESVVNAMDDTALGEFAKSCSAFAQPAAPAPAEGGGVALNGDGGPMSQNKGTTPGDAGGTGQGSMTPQQYAEKLRADITKDVLKSLNLKGSEGEAAVARVKEIDQNTARRLFSDKVKGLLLSGKMAPSVNEGGLIESIAMDICVAPSVRKFGDKELSLESRFSLLIDRLEAQVLPKLGERAPSGETDARKYSDTQKDAEVVKVKAHYQRYGERYSKTGTTEEDFVKAFKYEQKERGKTAEDYTGERD